MINKKYIINNIKNIIKWTLIGSIITFFLVYLISFLLPFPIEKMEYMKQQRSSTIILDKNGKSLREFRGNADSWTFWTPLKNMDPQIINAIIATEDERFFYHLGVDPLSAIRATFSNIFSFRRVSGASTLSMQCIRMLYQRPRTFKTKLIESFMALQLEHNLTKNEILELYLNIAPFGSNFYGIEAASQIYFNKKSSNLTLSETALLVGIPQRPAHLRPDIHAKKSKKRRDFVLNRMYKEKYISLKERNYAQAEPVITYKNKINCKAPHFSRLVKSKYKNRRKLLTTIDSQYQQIAKSALALHLKKFNNIHNGAIVLIENKTGAVRAMIGSNDFFDNKNYGQINYAIANRSPGSTLKPFIYLIGFDNKDILPSTIMADTPLDYKDYKPQNYDKKYHGKVSVREALVQSYNITAVRLIQKYGISSFTNLMLKCGISTLNKSDKYYGLPLILGSGEINLLELTSAYTIFPNSGQYIPYKFLENEKREGRQVISSSATYFITNILKDKTRNLGGGYLNLVNNKNNIAWKTGTSYGNHDAWTIGYNRLITVGVWLGNATGKTSNELVGIKSAAPLCIEIINELSKNINVDFKKDFNIEESNICSISGKIAGPYCLIQEVGEVIKDSKYEICDVHKIIYKTENNKSKYKSKGIIIEEWGKKFNFLDKIISPKNRNIIKILSPQSTNYVKINDNEVNQKIQFKADTNSKYVYWFINDKFYKKTENSTPCFWELQQGTFKITCSDDNGNKQSIKINVKEQK